MTVFWSPENRPDTPFGVCSRNFELKRDETNAWWEAAVKYGLEEKLRGFGREIALQVELVGPSMNGNRDLLPERAFRVFRIWDIANQCYVPSGERVELCKKLGIPHVPVINPAMDVFSELPTMYDVLKFAEGVTENGHKREGLVFKEADSAFPRSFKAVFRYNLQGLEDVIGDIPTAPRGRDSVAAAVTGDPEPGRLVPMPDGDFEETIPLQSKYDGRKTVLIKPEPSPTELDPRQAKPDTKGGSTRNSLQRHDGDGAGVQPD